MCARVRSWGCPIGLDSTAYAGRAHAWCARCIAMGDAPSIVEGSMCVSHGGYTMHSSVSCSTGAPHRVQGGPGDMGIVTTMPKPGNSLPPERVAVHSARIRVNRHGSLACYGAAPHQRRPMGQLLSDPGMGRGAHGSLSGDALRLHVSSSVTGGMGLADSL